MRVAAIDCGTNSLRLLVADAAEPGGVDRLVELRREMRIVRLGQDVDRTGVLAPEAIERTRVVLAEYAATVDVLGVDRLRMVATSATRDAANRADFAAMVRATLGVEAEVATGAEEAALSFAGAIGGLGAGVGPGPVLVADIGGGSTELVLGERTGGGLRGYSMDVGAVRMTERHLHTDPPTTEQVAATVADVTAALVTAGREVPLDAPATLVGVAGTITTVAALALGLPRYDSARVHGATLTADQVEETVAALLGMTRDQRSAHEVIHPGRVDVIAGGALVLRTVLRRLGSPELHVSERDILDGIALGLLADPGAGV